METRKKIFFAIACCAITVVAAKAQHGPQTALQVEEMKKLASYAGSWQSVGEFKPGPFGPGGKFTSNDHAELMQGGTFLINHSEFQSPFGPGVVIGIIGYDPEHHSYTFDSFNSVGQHLTATGAYQDGKMVWKGEQNGMKMRFTQEDISPTSYAFKLEMCMDGTNWFTFEEARATKQ